MIINTATIYASFALFIMMLVITVYLTIFFSIFYIIGWALLRFFRPITRLMHSH